MILVNEKAYLKVALRTYLNTNLLNLVKFLMIKKTHNLIR
jgi:hypothetical protein